jgi:ABC-type branched-subunit amino acid transport system ATPase component/predicted MFS family arabinose efflux permease
VSPEPDTEPPDFADLAATLVAPEPADGVDDASPVDDRDLPGVGGAPMGLRDALRAGGPGTLVVLVLLGVAVELDNAVLTVLAPDIQESLGVGDALTGAIVGATGALTVLGGVPLAVLADRFPRLRLASLATVVWAVFAVLGGLARNAFTLFLTRAGVGLGQAYQVPIPNPVLADRYPLEARGTVLGVQAASRSLGAIIGPLAAGGVAALAGGAAGWRWAFVAPAAVAVVVAVAAARLPEPLRGGNEQRAVLGEVLAAEHEHPVSMAAAFARLRRIRTFSTILLGVSALGFGLFATPFLISLHLEERYGYDEVERAVVLAVMAGGALVLGPLVGRIADRLARDTPVKVLLLAASMIAAFGVLTPIALFLPGIVAVVAVLTIGAGCAQAGFVALAPVTSIVVPYRLRSQGFAMFGVYLFLYGAFGGLLLGGLISDALGERAAIAILTPPTALLGAALIARGAIHVRADIALVVAELHEERDERVRRAAAPGAVPLLQIRNLDVSYGPVQVLFGVDLDVHEGEVVALLGTNGAGKSTILRAVSGLHVPDRGVIRVDGRTITFAEPELRYRLGIVQVRGGAGVYPGLSVRDNLLAFQLAARRSRAEALTCVDEVLEVLPALGPLLDRRAGSLSGGQQQMLALAVAFLGRPRLLIIDELSLGLAPVVVGELLAVLERLKAAGTTMLVVEQSLNVALAVADRAVFLEKGQVRFEGPAADLAGRDDLVRAVFLGAGEGG